MFRKTLNLKQTPLDMYSVHNQSLFETKQILTFKKRLFQILSLRLWVKINLDMIFTTYL